MARRSEASTRVDASLPTPDDLRRMIPDREAYDRALGVAVRRSTDLLSVVSALHVPPNGVTERPVWLSTIADAYVRAHRAAAGHGKPVLALVSAPPQSGKTTLAEVAYAWWLARRPQDPLGWLSYGAELSKDKSRRIRDLTRRLQVQIRTDSSAAERWQTTAGGGLLAKGLAGAIVGMPGLACVIVDDPYESKSKAYSAAHRRWVRSQVQATVISRRNPRTSVFIQHTRWAVDDLIGWLQDEFGDLFEVIVVTAVDEETSAPIVTLGGRDSAFWLQQQQLSGPEWWPLYMGSPRARDGSLFQDRGVVHYSERPSSGRTVIGLDFAYSTRKTADWSVAVVLRRVDQRAYVMDVVRLQVPAPEFAAAVLQLQQRYSGAPIHAYIGGTEVGIADFFSTAGVKGLTTHRAGTDKVARATACAAEWNAGNILVAEKASWTGDFVSELLNFGSGGHDDQVDALVGAFDHCVWTGARDAIVQPRVRRVYDSGDDLRDRLQSGAGVSPRDAAETYGGSDSARRVWRPGSGRLPTKHGW